METALANLVIQLVLNAPGPEKGGRQGGDLLTPVCRKGFPKTMEMQFEFPSPPLPDPCKSPWVINSNEIMPVKALCKLFLLLLTSGWRGCLPLCSPATCWPRGEGGPGEEGAQERRGPRGGGPNLTSRSSRPPACLIESCVKGRSQPMQQMSALHPVKLLQAWATLP